MIRFVPLLNHQFFYRKFSFLHLLSVSCSMFMWVGENVDFSVQLCAAMARDIYISPVSW